MSVRNFIASDPERNRLFSRRWTEKPEHISAPVSRLMRHLERQQHLSHIAKLLTSCQQNYDNPEAVSAAFAAADRLRQSVGVSWSELIAERKRAA